MKPRVAVLCGGVSAEHQVSLVSASEVCQALRVARYPFVVCWIDPDGGDWHWLPPLSAGFEPTDLARLGAASDPQAPLKALLELRRRGVDVVFPVLHGPGGEDGRLQACLEAANTPYVGSGVAASAVGMSKHLTRCTFLGAGLPMPRAFVPERAEAEGGDPADLLRRIIDEAELDFPLFLKSDNSGSSLGVERIAAPADFAPALARVRQMDDFWLVEEGVSGVELTCPVLGNSGQTLRPLPPVQITPRFATFFDYDSKYERGATEEICPPTLLSVEEVLEVQSLAIQAHDLLGCHGFSRTDMILKDGQLQLLETNTIPGMTPTSLLPRAVRAGGLDMPGLVDELVRLALQRPTPGRARKRSQRRPIGARTSLGTIAQG